jgi:hypothetical protein
MAVGATWNSSSISDSLIKIYTSTATSVPYGSPTASYFKVWNINKVIHDSNLYLYGKALAVSDSNANNNVALWDAYIGKLRAFSITQSGGNVFVAYASAGLNGKPATVSVLAGKTVHFDPFQWYGTKSVDLFMTPLSKSLTLSIDIKGNMLAVKGTPTEAENSVTYATIGFYQYNALSDKWSWIYGNQGSYRGFAVSDSSLIVDDNINTRNEIKVITSK